MKRTLTPKTCLASAMTLAAIQSVYAQNGAPFGGYLNEYLRGNYPAAKAWDIGGEDRLRYESKQGMAVAGQPDSVDFRDHGATVSNDYLLNRFRLHVGYSQKWWGVYGEAQSSAAFSDARYAYPNSPVIPETVKRKGDGPESDTIDLHQAYFYVGDPNEFPLTLKAGRQELSYGEERLIGAFGWNNIGRVFDAAKVRWQNELFGVDFFTSHVVVPQDNRFDTDNTQDWFSGVYATSTNLPINSVEVYFLARDASRSAIHEEPSPQFGQPTARDIYTVGGRLKSKPGEIGNFDYTVEGAYQFGRFAPTATAASLGQDAFMAVAQAGYTFTDLWAKPRIGMEYSYGSGDNNPTDKTHGTFENLFPTNHKFYGYMDFFSLQNIQDVRAVLQLKPASRVNLAVEGHGFWLANSQDFLYAVGGAPRTVAGYGINPTYNSFVGTELDVVASYTVARSAQVEAGYGHFFTGNYINSSLAGVGGDRDADWFYAQVSFKF